MICVLQTLILGLSVMAVLFFVVVFIFATMINQIKLQMERKYIVYIHTCPNSKVYIGITNRKPEIRWNNGKGYTYNLHFWHAIQKYGWDNIKHEILFEGLTEDEAKNKEKELIAKYKSNNGKYGYNLTEGGDGTYGYKHTDKTKEKCRQARLGKTPWNKGKHTTEEAKEKSRLSHSGKHHTEQTKEKIRQGMLGENNPMYGKHMSEEWKRKQSERMKGKNKGKKWWNNGEEEIPAFDCPSGFIAGRLKKKQ